HLEAPHRPLGARVAGARDRAADDRPGDARRADDHHASRSAHQQRTCGRRRAGANHLAGDHAAHLARALRDYGNPHERPGSRGMKNARVASTADVVGVAPRRSASPIGDYIALTKPRLNLLVVASSAAGYYLGATHGIEGLPM